MAKKLTTTEWVKKAKKTPKQKGKNYKFDLVDYKNNATKVKIICPKDGHGIFEITPCDFLGGHGCGICGGKKKHTQESALKKCYDLNGTKKFDYSKFIYVSNKKKVILGCLTCGNWFEQTPSSHWRGDGCKKCSGLEKYIQELALQKCYDLNGTDKFDYSKFIYNGANEYSIIICLTCGVEFQQTPGSHWRGIGCLKCSGSKQLNSEEWVEKAKNSPKQLNKNYGFHLVNYKNNHTKVDIWCPIEGHGIFQIRPSHFINGGGCHHCKESRGEKITNNFLKNNFVFERQNTFDDCRNIRILYFDFWLSEHNVLIEFDGQQHFESKEWFGGEEAFVKRQINDAIKTKYAKDNNIPLLRIHYKDIEKTEFLIREFLALHNIYI